MRTRRSSSAWSRALSALFLLALAAPGALMLGGRRDADLAAFEFRMPAPPPAISADPATWIAWPADFEDWFSDRFPARSLLLRLRARVHWYGLHHSPAEIVVRGRDEWLFLTSDEVLATGAGDSPLTEREVDDWLDAIERRAGHLARRGSTYLFAIAPDKNTVYPERLPWNHRGDGARRIDQLAARAAERGMRHVLDLRDATLAEKEHDRPGDLAYYPLGAHWTPRGTFGAARAIAERLTELGVPVTPIARVDLVYRPSETQGDSHAAQLYLEDELLQEFGAWAPARRVAGRRTGFDRETRSETFERDLPDAPTLVVFHDSFGENLQEILSPSFRRADWHWKPYDHAHVVDPAPDVVLELFVERRLATSLPPGCDPDDQPWWADAFERSGPRAAVLGPADLLAHLSAAGSASLLPSVPGAAAGPGLVFPGPGATVELDLAGLTPGEDYVVRLTLTSVGPGKLRATFPFRTGPPAYAIERVHRTDLDLERGRNVVHLHLARQRTRDAVDLWTQGRPQGFALHAVEVRLLRPDAVDATAAPAR